MPLREGIKRKKVKLENWVLDILMTSRFMNHKTSACHYFTGVAH